MWLYSPAVPPGKVIEILTLPPNSMVMKSSSNCLMLCTYCIADLILNITDNLIDICIFKLCPPDTCLPPIEQTLESPVGQSTSTHSSVPFRIHLQLVGDNDPSDFPRHYPQCSHQPSARYTDNDL